MDVSAFETDAGGGVSWDDLPEGVREPIRHATHVCWRLGGFLLIIASAAGCVLAFALMLIWIGLYWLLTHLLLHTAAFLRVVYQERSTLGASHDATRDFSITSRDGPKAGLSSDETPATLQYQPPQPSISGIDLDLFESYLGTSESSQDPVYSKEVRERALKKILRQEEELNAQIRASQEADAQNALTPQQRKEQKQAADQDAWLDRLTSSQRKVSQRGVNSAEHSNRSSAFTPEQLAEAANFAKSATRGKGSVRSEVKHRSPVITKPHRNALLDAKNAVRALDPRRPANLNFRFTESPNFVPPHLQKLNAIKAAKAQDSTKTATESSSPEPAGPKILQSSPTVQPNDSSHSSPHTKQHLTNYVPPLPAAKPNSADQSSKTVSGYDDLQGSTTKTTPRISAFEKLPRGDDAEPRGQRLGECSDCGGEPGSVVRDSAIPLTQPIERGTMINVLKSLDPNSLERGTGRRRHNMLPGSFIVKIERATRIVTGKEEGLQRIVRPAEQPRDAWEEDGISGTSYLDSKNTTALQDTWPSQDQQSNVTGDHRDVADVQQAVIYGANGSNDIPQGSAPTPSGQHEHETDDDVKETQDSTRLSRTSEQEEPHCSQLQEATTAQPASEISKARSPRVPVLSQRPNTSPVPRASTPVGEALFTQMADIMEKRVAEQNVLNAPRIESSKSHDYAPVGQDADAKPSPATSTPAKTSDRHELDLLGLVFSSSTKPDSSSTQASPAPTPSIRPPKLQSSAQEFTTSKLTSSARAPAPFSKTVSTATARPPMSTTASIPTYHPGLQPSFPVYDSFAQGGLNEYLLSAPHAFENNGIIAPPLHVPQSTFNYPGPTAAPVMQTSGWDSHLFQSQIPPPEQAVWYPNSPFSAGTEYHVPHPQPTFASAVPALPPKVRPASVSKAIKITKPTEVKYEEEFPSLPGAPKAKVQPPPGLGPSKASNQNAFDTLLRQPKSKNTFDALVEKAESVPKTNPFDALMSSASGPQPDTTSANTHTSSQDEQDRISSNDSEPGSKTVQKKRKQVRTALTRAWYDREDIRKRLIGTYTLDGHRALEYATKTYNDKRHELASLMATGQLREEDAAVFPHLSVNDLNAPRARPAKTDKASPDDDIDRYLATAAKKTSPGNVKQENKAPKKTGDELNELVDKAINARNVYSEAHAFFTRPPPQGRSDHKQLRAQGEARIERAAKIYAARREELTAAYGGALPSDIKDKLWTFDDAAGKKSRDTWMK